MLKVRMMPETHGAILEHHGRKVAPCSRDYYRNRWLSAGSLRPASMRPDIMLDNTCNSLVASRR